MATYYWVGGSGTWDGTTTTNWSLASGGSGSAGVPTSADDVIFNSASNATAYTVTMGTGAVCRSMTMAGPASGNLTWAGTAGLTIYGSMTVASVGITRTYTGALTFSATTTGWTVSCGVTLSSSFVFNGVGGGWSLASALALTAQANSITITAGALSTANYNISNGGSFINSGSAVASLSLGSSSISMAQGGGISFSGTNFTFNAGTSTITTASTIVGTSTLSASGYTFYNYYAYCGGANPIFTGSNTFNNLTLNNNSNTRIQGCIFNNDQTVNGTFSVFGNGSATSRVEVYSGTLGTQRTITAAAVSLTDADFADIIGAGAATWSGTRLGDGGNNSNITFSTPKTVYWNLAAGGQWNSTAWATSSGGTPAVNNFPLPQDTAIIQDTGLSSGSTISTTQYAGAGSTSGWCGNIDISSRTLPMTLTPGAQYYLGNVALSSAVTITASSTFTMAGRGSTAITANSAVLGNTVLTVSAVGGTVAFGSAWSTTGLINVTSGTLSVGASVTNSAGITQTGGSVNLGVDLTTTTTYTFTAGTLSLGANTLNVSAFSSNNSNVRTIAFGSGQINLNGTGTVWTTSTGTNFAITGTSKVNVTNSGATATTITGGSVSEAGSVNFYITGGTYALTKSGSFRSIDYTGFSGSTSGATTIYGNLTLAGTMTGDSSPYSFSATSGTQTFTPNGRSITGALTMNGVGGTVTLGGALSSNTTVTISGSTFNQAYSLACTTISYTGAGAWTTSANITNSGAITVNGASSKWTLNSGTVSGAVTLTTGTITIGGTVVMSSSLTHTAGTIAIGNNSLSVGTVSSSNTNTRSITFGSGTLTITGSGAAAWNYATSTGLSITPGTGTISMTSGAAKTFAGGSYTNYPTLNNGGAGALTISGSNTFAGISNSVQPTTFTFTSGTTQTVSGWNVNGTSGNLVTINASTAGTQATLSYIGSGTVTSGYLSVKDSAATPSPIWFATNSTNVSNNTGWTFGSAPIGATGNFLMFF